VKISGHLKDYHRIKAEPPTFTKNVRDYSNIYHKIIVICPCVCSDKNNLHFGAIVCMLGCRYKSYCSNIVRTLMVDPPEEMQKNYELLVEAEEKIIAMLKDGKILGDRERGNGSRLVGTHPLM
jgi:hypothetical protein